MDGADIPAPLYMHMRTRGVWLRITCVTVYLEFTTIRAGVYNKHGLTLISLQFLN